jgi:hypothetical protein
MERVNFIRQTPCWIDMSPIQRFGDMLMTARSSLFMGITVVVEYPTG